jgi:hypothetical protein
VASGEKTKSRSLAPICKDCNWARDDTQGRITEKADPSPPFAKAATGFGMTPKAESRKKQILTAICDNLYARLPRASAQLGSG